MKKFIIIDGNSQIYRAFYSPGPDLHAPRRDVCKRCMGTGESFVDEEPGNSLGAMEPCPECVEPTKATYGFLQMLIKVCREQQPDYLAMAMDAPRAGLWRKRKFPDYKGERKPKPPELIRQKKRIEQIVRLLGVPVLESVEDEADDIIATLVDACPNVHSLIITKDHDLYQMVSDTCHVFDPMTVETVTPRKVQDKFGVPPSKMVDYLALVGGHDNIPGVPGCGPVTAREWIRKYGGLEDMFLAECFKPGIIKGFDFAKAKMSQELTRLNVNAEFNIPEQGYKFRGLDMDAAKPVFRGLGFKRWS